MLSVCHDIHPPILVLHSSRGSLYSYSQAWNHTVLQLFVGMYFRYPGYLFEVQSSTAILYMFVSWSCDCQPFFRLPDIVVS